jgi:hypothetical protein
MNTMQQWIRISVWLVCWLLVLSSPGWALTLSFNPSSSTIGLGGTLAVDIKIDGLENDDLSAFAFNVNYDDSILSFDSYSLGDQLGEIPSEALDLSLGDLGGGVIDLAETSLLFDFSSQPDAFTLATVSFTADALGESMLDITEVSLVDGDFFAPGFLPASVEPGSVNVAPVPEPGTVVLMLVGIGGLGILKRRRS